MQANGRSSPARLLAPLALILFTLALVVVVVTSNGGDGDHQSPARRSSAVATTPKRTPAVRGPATYTVKTGDTLGAIAQKTGVSVDRIQELNPELDPQALLSGQKIKLRE